MASGSACTPAMRFPRRAELAAATEIRGTGGPAPDVVTLCARNIGEVAAQGDRNRVGPPMATRAAYGAGARNCAGGRKRPAEPPCGAHRKLVSRHYPSWSADPRRRQSADPQRSWSADPHCSQSADPQSGADLGRGPPAQVGPDPQWNWSADPHRSQSADPRRNLVPRLLAGAEAGRVPRACLRDLRCHERAPQGTVGPFLQLCLYETRVVNS